MSELLEAFQGTICSDCEHEPHGNEKCYDMDFNGTVWSNCRCKSTPQTFCFVLTPDEFANVSRIHDNRKIARAA